MTTALARYPATPYARRLARERGFTLASIAGSGPDGRIVAADVEAYIAPKADAPAAAPAAGPTVSAFAATVDFTSIQKLLADFGAAGMTVTLDALLIRAAALALEAVPEARRKSGITVGWETGDETERREMVIADAHLGMLSGLAARLAPAAPQQAAASASLYIRRIVHTGIRPVAMPLQAGHPSRLIVSAADSAALAECLLCFDADALGEDAGAALLSWFRDGLETPMRLLA